MKRRSRSIVTRKFNSMLLGGSLSIMVVSVMLMSDSLIAGIFLGEDAVAGITLVTPLYSVSAFFSTVFAIGVPLLYSTEIGAFRKKEADRVFQTGILMAIVVGSILFISISAFGNTYLLINYPSEDIYEAAAGYLFYIRFTILLIPLQALMAECVYADGDETVSAAANLTQAIGNVAGSIILVNIMGIRGISLASVIFYVVSLLILGIHFVKDSNTLKLGISFSYDIIKKIVSYSVVDAGTYLFIGLLTAILNMFVGIRFGAKTLILVSVLSLCRELQLVFDGIGEAMTPIISTYIGEGCTAGVRKLYYHSKKVAIAEGIIVTILIFFAAPYVPRILQITDSFTSNEAVVTLRIIALGSVFISLLYFETSYYILVDRIPLAFLASALRDLLLPAALALFCGYFWGIYGVFVGVALGPLVATILTNFYLWKKDPKDIPLLLGAKRDLPSFLYDYSLNENQITRMRDSIAEDLFDYGCNKSVVNKIMLLFEETSMLILEKNKGNMIEAECTLLILNDRLRMIIRDTGVSFDITDSDMLIDSLRSYVVSSVGSYSSISKQHMAAMSFNRNVFDVRLE